MNGKLYKCVSLKGNVKECGVFSGGGEFRRRTGDMSGGDAAQRKLVELVSDTK